MYVCIHVYTCVCIYIYVYIYIIQTTYFKKYFMNKYQDKLIYSTNLPLFDNYIRITLNFCCVTHGFVFIGTSVLIDVTKLSSIDSDTHNHT